MAEIIRINDDNFPLYRDSILEIENLSFITPWSQGAFMGEIANRFSRLWISSSTQGSVDGYICFWNILDEIHLLNLAVHPMKRGRGLGRTMMDSMLHAAAIEGARTVWLEVRPSNLHALSLYRSKGFVETGRRARYYSDTGEDAIVMSLDLKGFEYSLSQGRDTAGTLLGRDLTDSSILI